jgi:transcriptional antiterminator Rof (Rho-off)
MRSEPYVPVNCGFHDRLLDFATRAQTVTVLLKGGMNRFDTKIKDVFTRGGAEFITFDNG